MSYLRLNSYIKKIIFIFVFYLILAAVIFAIFEQRSSTQQSGILAFTYDTNMYIRAIEGEFTPEPFSTRFLIFYLAKIFPDAATGLFWINSISMIILLVSLHLLSDIFYQNKRCSVAVVLSVVSTFSFLYNFQNPFLTDIPAMAFLALFIFYCYKNKFIPALICICISICFRETAIIFFPIAFIKFDAFKGVTLAIFSMFWYIAPKIYLAGSVYSPEINLSLIDLFYFGKVSLSFGIFLLISALSLFRYFPRLDKFSLSIILISVVGALYSSLTAFDTTRMMFIMAPSITILLTFFVREIGENSFYQFVTIALSNFCINLFIIPSIFNKMAEISSFDESVLKYIAPVAMLSCFQLILLRKILNTKT